MTMLTLAEAAQLLGGELAGCDAPVHAVATDSRSLKPGDLFCALRGPRFDGHEFIAMAKERGACGALVERVAAVELPQIRVADTRLALGRLAAGWRRRMTLREAAPLRLIALTGSNGKTTVKEMIAAILRRRGEVLATQGNLNNDIGVPATLLRLTRAHAYGVIEMGANHLGEIAYLSDLTRPDVALITNAGPAHLEGFGDLDGVARGKGEIFHGLGPQGVAIINRDDPYADYWSGLAHERRVIGFSLGRPAEVAGRLLDEARNRFRLTLEAGDVDIELPMPGRHNIRNALAAAAAGTAVGATPQDIRHGLEQMRGVSGRLQRLAGRHGSTLINDTYNANPASLEAGLFALGPGAGTKWLVLGDMGELGPGSAALHEQAGRLAREAGFQRLYALGRLSRQAALAFGRDAAHFETVEALVQALGEAVTTDEGKPVILIKGSRSMRMERIVAALVDEASPSADAGAHS